jgi:hypothetical protein
MRLERASIALHPRSIGSCIDLALVFVGRRFATFSMVTACFAIPAGIASYLLARSTDSGLLWSAAVFSLVSAPLGVCLVVAATHSAFDERCGIGQVLRDGLWRQGKATWLTLLFHPVETALPLLCLAPLARLDNVVAGVVLMGFALACLLPGIALGLPFSFMAESGALKSFRRQRHDHRTKDLIRQEYVELLVRAVALWIFGVMLWGIVTITVDFASTLMLGVPLILGRVSQAVHNPWGAPDFEDLSRAFLNFCSSDPVALCTLTVTALCVYAMCRLAWFFSYVDLRIRRDCWDLEVALADEAQALESPA